MKNISFGITLGMLALSMIGYILTKIEVSPSDPYLYLISVQIWMATMMILIHVGRNKS